MATPTIKAGEVKSLPLTAIKPDPENIRKTFDQVKLKELADDIKLRGVEQPIIITKNGTGFTIKHGERRYRAAKQAKLKTIPCILAEDDKAEDADFKRLVDQYAENMLRDDLNPMDMAYFFLTCREAYGMKVTEIPGMLQQYGIKRPYDHSTISTMINLTKLPDWAQGMIRDGNLSASHGRLLTSIIGLDEKYRHSVKNLIEKALKSDENFTIRDLAWLLNTEARKKFTVADKAHSYEGMNLGAVDRPLYDVKKLKPEEKEKLQIVSIPVGHGTGSNEYITNLAAHKELQEAAKVKIQESWKKAAEKTKKAGQKKKAAAADEEAPNTGPSEKGLLVYLHTWLRSALLKRLDAIDISDGVFERLLYWLAFNAPTEAKSWYAGGDIDLYFAGNLATGQTQEEIILPSGLFSLKDYLTQKLDDEKLLRLNAARAVELCETNHRCYLAKHLGVDIDQEFRITDDFLKLYRKAGILQLAIDAGIDVTAGDKPALRMDRRPVGELRQVLVEQHAEQIGCPGAVLLFVNENTRDYEACLEENRTGIAEGLKLEAEGKLAGDDDEDLDVE